MKVGWQTKTINQISVNLDNKRVPITKADRTRGKYPYYGASGIVDYVADYIFDGDTLLISEDGANLLARSTPIAFPASGKYWVNNHAHILKFEDITTQRFVELYLESIPLDDYITGAAQPKLNQQALNSIPIPYPPLPEQQRIVGILDQAFAGIATAKANAEKNLQNARALFESHLQSVFTQRGDGWIRKKLGDVFKTSTGSTPPKNNSEFYGSFMPLVKPPELCGEAFDSATDGLSEAGAAVARTIPAKSVLVSCIGNLGKIGYNTVPVAFNQQINAILPNESQAIPEFMFFQSLSFFFKSQLETFASGTTIPIVNKSKFNSVNVVLPPLRIQKLVVPQLSSLREETHNLESIYKQKLTALDELKKSLLHQAFSGQL